MTSKRVLITGTTSGVGRALLEHYVRLGADVVSVNRRRVAALEAEYPDVRFECVDVRDEQAVSLLVNELATNRILPDLFVLSAGINAVDNDESFDLDEYKSVIETNLYGVLHFVSPLTEVPKKKVGHCHVVAVSSMAGFVGNPYGLGYFTSKRALSSCFDIWSKMYAGTDLIFQQVILGPVPTSIITMEDRMPAWMVRARDAFSGTPEGAARAIADFAVTRRKRLYYPGRAVPLFLGMKIGQSLIPGFYQGRRTLAGSFRRHTKREP